MKDELKIVKDITLKSVAKEQTKKKTDIWKYAPTSSSNKEG